MARTVFQEAAWALRTAIISERLICVGIEAARSEKERREWQAKAGIPTTKFVSSNSINFVLNNFPSELRAKALPALRGQFEVARNEAAGSEEPDALSGVFATKFSELLAPMVMSLLPIGETRDIIPGASDEALSLITQSLILTGEGLGRLWSRKFVDPWEVTKE